MSRVNPQQHIDAHLVQQLAEAVAKLEQLQGELDTCYKGLSLKTARVTINSLSHQLHAQMTEVRQPV